MNAEVEMTSLDDMLLPMELLYTGQVTMDSWKLYNYSFEMEQVLISSLAARKSKLTTCTFS